MIPRKIIKCIECKKIISTKNNNPIYRCCDAYVCSEKCSKIRMDKIVEQDPQLINTHLWHLPNLNIMDKYDFQIENYEDETKSVDQETQENILKILIYKCWKLIFY